MNVNLRMGKQVLGLGIRVFDSIRFDLVRIDLTWLFAQWLTHRKAAN